MEATSDTGLKKPLNNYYDLLRVNKNQFFDTTTEELIINKGKGGRDRRTRLLKILDAIQNGNLDRCTEEQEDYLKKVIKQVEEAGLTNETVKNTLKALDKEMKNNNLDTLYLIRVLKKNIPSDLMKKHISESAANTEGPREVILSEYYV